MSGGSFLWRGRARGGLAEMRVVGGLVSAWGECMVGRSHAWCAAVGRWVCGKSLPVVCQELAGAVVRACRLCGVWWRGVVDGVYFTP